METIVITEGDPAGISNEILKKSRAELIKASKKFQILFIKTNHSLVLDGFEDVQSPPNKKGLFQITVPIFSKEEKGKIKIGKPSELTGKAAFASLLEGISILKKLHSARLITLPLSKEWVIRSGVSHFRGHTETLAEEFKKSTFMMMKGKKWNVIPLTTHVPLVRVGDELKRVNWEGLVDAIRKTSLLKKPRIAVLGVNPHSGEGGKIGREEIDILEPKIEFLRKAGFSVQGPIPGDSAFLNHGSFDLYLATFHDQGLIPFKLMEGKSGVNVTLGLDFLRVSPDHGTAFDIAGKGKADPLGFLSCLALVTKGK